MLLWEEKFATGSPTIDEQHRQLIEHLNQFEGLVLKTNPTPADITLIIHFLDFLENYVDKHFSFEEQCMESYRCPAHQKNREAHQNFLQLFQQHKRHAQKAGFRVELLVELSRATNHWIQDHILRVDVELKPCLAKAAA